MEDLKLVEELLLNNLFIILYQKLKITQSQPNHLYPQATGSNPRSETGYTHRDDRLILCKLQPLATTVLTFKPKRLTLAKRPLGLGHRILPSHTITLIWSYLSQ